MKVSCKVTSLQKQQKSCLVLGIHEDGPLTPTVQAIDKASHGGITKLLKQGAFSGKMGQTLHLYHFANTAYDHLLLVGCGKAKALTPMGFYRLNMSAAKALNAVKARVATHYLTEITVGTQSTAWKVKQITQATFDGLYCFDLFKTDKQVCALQELTIALPQAKDQKACDKALQQGEAIAHAMQLTKNLANTPSNICTPSFLAEQAKNLAKTLKHVSVKVLGEKEMQKLGMGALLAVSQGSAEEAKLICIEYRGASKTQPPVAFVGKGITFDSGGNSLKSPDNMVGMKYDMCGAATVIGTLHAAASLKLPINVVGIIAAVENMPGGTAYKPEDILTSLAGITIEVISTDAEGRLVLADALTYCERYKPAAVIDIATLTGAVVIALGYHTTGLLTNDEPLAKALLVAGEESNDRAWQLPLFEEYQEQIKSPFADIANTGGRSAGTITAACFLSRFTKKFHWAHLDVAGTAAMMGGTQERMATGRPVPMLVQYLLNLTKSA